MADPFWWQVNFVSYIPILFIPMHNWTRGGLRSLITNLPYKFNNFKNLNWQIQYGCRKTFYFIFSWKIGHGDYCGHWPWICFRISAILKIQHCRSSTMARKFFILFLPLKIGWGLLWGTNYSSVTKTTIITHKTH